MDGWGIGNKDIADAIHNATTPYIDQLNENPKIAKARLETCGEEVGLPEGQMGNSEVGHMNIGAGRIVYQDLVRINRSIADKSINTNQALTNAFDYAKKNNKKVHLIGLVSNGGVHSSMEHLKTLISIAEDKNINNIFVHALMDGRDTDPRSGLGFITELQNYTSNKNAKIASVCGRYYGMDRDKRWDRVKKSYDLMVSSVGNTYSNPIEAVKTNYDNNITDEFIEPSVIVDSNGLPLAKIEENDVVICFNFRTDRLREITTVLTQQDMPEEGMQTIPLQYYTMTQYDESFKNINLIFGKDDITETMGEWLSKHDLKQLRIAETEKYPHVSFFFSGGSDKPFEGEERIMVNSPKVATYDLKPEMSAPEVTTKVIEAIESEKFDFICLNFANADMVGHTGIYEAILKAIETVDTCVGKVMDTARKYDYSVLLTADHGNSDYAKNPDGSPNTAHSLNSVPVYIVDPRYTTMKNGRLADIAPTMLYMMGLDIPEKMTGDILV